VLLVRRDGSTQNRIEEPSELCRQRTAVIEPQKNAFGARSSDINVRGPRRARSSRRRLDVVGRQVSSQHFGHRSMMFELRGQATGIALSFASAVVGTVMPWAPSAHGAAELFAALGPCAVRSNNSGALGTVFNSGRGRHCLGYTPGSRFALHRYIVS
jgi:hypothetical protein